MRAYTGGGGGGRKIVSEKVYRRGRRGRESLREGVGGEESFRERVLKAEESFWERIREGRGKRKRLPYKAYRRGRGVGNEESF